MPNQLCLCGQPMHLRRRFSEHFDTLNCQCGTQMFVTAEGAEKISFNYDGSDEKYGSAAYLQGEVFRWAHDQIAQLLSKAAQRGPCKTLEVGCFNGFFVNRLVKAGVDAHGTDLNAVAVGAGQAKWQLANRLTTRLEDALAAGPYDFILLIDCLEHIEDPSAFMELLKAHLADGGTIIVSGPVQERFFYDKSDFPPHHIWRFSRVALKSAGARFGMKSEEYAVQYDTALFLRNMIGRLKHGFFTKEYQGEAASIADNQIPSIILTAGRIAGAIGNPVLRALNKPYCSSVQLFTKQ